LANAVFTYKKIVKTVALGNSLSLLVVNNLNRTNSGLDYLPKEKLEGKKSADG
jgi:hypothetical protein